MPDSKQEKSADWILAALDEFETPLLRYAARLLGGNLDLAGDVVQHVFLKLCQQERENVQGHLAKWLYMVCRNRTIDELRKRSKDSPLSVESDDKMDFRNDNPEMEIEKKDFVTFLKELIAQLPGGQREALELWAGGLKYNEIASVIGKSEGSIRVLVHRGIKSLKTHPEVAKWLDSQQPQTKPAGAAI